MSQGGALNTLAQLQLWRLELRVVSTVIAVVVFGVIIAITWAFGADVGAAALLTFFAAVAAYVVYAIARVVYLWASPAAQARQYRRAEADYAKTMARIRADMEMP